MNPVAIQRAERYSVQSLPEVDKEANSFNTSAFWSDVSHRGEILPDPVTRQGERWLRWYDRQNMNTLWHGAKSGLMKKIGATPYELKGGRNLTSYFDDVLRYAQFGAGFRQLIELIANDYFVFNGGAYMEVIAPGNPLRPPTGRATGLAHLDSFMCVPTGNPEYPVVYTDRKGMLHLLHHTRVVHFVDTPDGDQNHPGYGRSALWRAIAICQRQILMNRYVVTGLDDKPPPGMLLVGGMTREKWNTVWAQFRSDQTTDEKPDWGRTIALFGVDADHAPKVESVTFSNPPDKFDYKVYVELDVHEMALAIGVDIQELWELTSGNLGTAGQSQVQHAKSQGKTYGEFLATFERAMNNYVLPTSLEFEFKVADPYEAQESASTAKMWADFITAAGSALTDDEKRQILANQVEAVADAIVDENGELIRLTDADPVEPEQVEVTVDDAAPQDETPPSAQGEDVTVQDNAPNFSSSGKTYDETRRAFVTDFSDLAEAGLADDVTRRRAGVVLRAQIARHGRAAYNDGLRAGGVEDGMSEDDLAAVTTLIAEQSSYVTDFLNSLYADGVTDVAAHSTMWANKSLQPFFDAGRLSADANGLYVWELGNAEHCASCLKMSGQKHRLKEYAAKGVMPKSSALECRGYNCACRLVKTSGRSKGGWL